MSARVIAFPYASPAARLAAQLAQRRNLSLWQPLPGETVRCADTQRLLRLECCAGHPARPLLWTCRDLATGLAVLRTPDRLLPAPAQPGAG